MTGAKRKWLLVLAGLVVVAILIAAFRPAPLPVDLEALKRGRLMVTVDEDGRTRIKDYYIISAPLAGRLLRIQLDPGDDARVADRRWAEASPESRLYLSEKRRAPSLRTRQPSSIAFSSSSSLPAGIGVSMDSIAARPASDEVARSSAAPSRWSIQI